MTGLATQVVLVVLVLLLVVVYVSWTAGRLDRMHARVDAAWAGLETQLVRRAAAARALVPYVGDEQVAARLEVASAASLAAGDDLRGAGDGTGGAGAPGATVSRVDTSRERVENDLSRALKGSVPLVERTPLSAAVLDELETASSRVGLARSFHNAAVDSTRALRRRRLPRVLRLAGHRAVPEMFDIDDTGAPPS